MKVSTNGIQKNRVRVFVKILNVHVLIHVAHLNLSNISITCNEMDLQFIFARNADV